MIEYIYADCAWTRKKKKREEIIGDERRGPAFNFNQARIYETTRHQSIIRSTLISLDNRHARTHTRRAVITRPINQLADYQQQSGTYINILRESAVIVYLKAKREKKRPFPFFSMHAFGRETARFSPEYFRALESLYAGSLSLSLSSLIGFRSEKTRDIPSACVRACLKASFCRCARDILAGKVQQASKQAATATTTTALLIAHSGHYSIFDDRWKRRYIPTRYFFFQSVVAPSSWRFFPLLSLYRSIYIYMRGLIGAVLRATLFPGKSRKSIYCWSTRWI